MLKMMLKQSRMKQKKKGGFLGMLLGTSLLGNMLSGREKMVMEQRVQKEEEQLEQAKEQHQQVKGKRQDF